MNTLFKTTALAFATSSLLLAGCGGSSSDGGGTSTQQTSGKVVDFYLKDASVLFKGCTGNSSSALTNLEGSFIIPDGCRPSEITVLGGIDIGTGLRFNGELKAPAQTIGSLIVSPLTTLISAKGGDRAALDLVGSRLGLSGNNILTTDPMIDKTLLRQTVVAQVLMNQVQNTLLKLSAATEGQLTAQQAAQAAVAGLADQFNSKSVNFTSSATISSMVEASVNNLARNRNITAFGSTAMANTAALAQNTAAVSTDLIQQEVIKADNAIKDVEIKGNPSATLAGLAEKLTSIRDANNSQLAANVVALVVPALYDINNKESLKNLGNAIATGSDADIATYFDSLANSLPAGTLDNLQKLNDNAATYTNYLNLVSVGFNKATPYSVEEAMQADKSDNGLAVTGGFNSVQLNIAKQGQPFTGNTLQARVGLSYTINNVNTLNIVVDKVNMTFANDKLSAVNIPAGTTFAFNTTGTIKASNPTLTNLGNDDLTVTDGILNLPVQVFLDKVSSKNPQVASAIAAYKPKAGDKVTISVSLTGITNPVEVGNTVSGANKAADTVVINTDVKNTNGDIVQKSIVGRGVNTKVTVSQ